MSDKDAPRCKKDVWGSGGYHPHRCERRATVGDFCKQHNPIAKRARDAVRDAEFNAQWDARRQAEAHAKRAQSLGEVALAAGIDDPERLRAILARAKP